MMKMMDEPARLALVQETSRRMLGNRIAGLRKKGVRGGFHQGAVEVMVQRVANMVCPPSLLHKAIADELWWVEIISGITDQLEALNARRA
jgi:hypothetical protein